MLTQNLILIATGLLSAATSIPLVYLSVRSLRDVRRLHRDHHELHRLIRDDRPDLEKAA